jgi:hypothetical protein
VPRILPVQLRRWGALHKQAAEVLYRFGGRGENALRNNSLEIHRLSFAREGSNIALELLRI